MASDSKAGRLYVVATSHLDTQWRWTVRDTIERFLPATFEEAFDRFERYPFFVLSFEGAFRYRLIGEYYPEALEAVRSQVAAGRWQPAGAMLDAPDVNIVGPESLIRQILYGNRFFEREFGVRCRDLFLPDCFGFTWALPTLARHCGLDGFSSQKMIKWTPSERIPFDLGIWEGPDGARLVSVLQPGGYGDGLDGDPSRSPEWIDRVRHNGEAHGVAVGYRYFGVGDRGGAPDEESIEHLGRALQNPGPLQVLHGGSSRFFADLSAEERECLPVHRSELLLPTHGTGCWTSQLRMKLWNRRCESLADAAERAASLAAWSGAMDYPAAELRRAWERFLWHQMHDDLTGTSIPEAYELSWNDQLLALDTFSTVLTDAVGAAARGLDTRCAGAPFIAYNPMARAHQGAVRVSLPGREAEAGVRVIGPDDEEVASQIVERRADRVDVLFQATVPALGLAVYRVAADPSSDSGSRTAASSEVTAERSGLENHRYRVAISAEGDIESVYDKRLQRDLLAAPIALQLLPDYSRRWPAWEVRWKDIQRSPRRLLGPSSIRVDEDGPVRAAVRIERRFSGSRVGQVVRLYAGDGPAAGRLEIDLELDWRTWRRMLKIAFPLAAKSAHATYDLGIGAIERGVNHRDAYEVPAQRWVSQTSGDGSWGVTLFTDGGYGWDKPDERTLRHTLIRSPMARHHFRHQSHQDFGPHRIRLALAGHEGDWAAADAPRQAEELHQPLLAFRTEAHAGPLGRKKSFLGLEGDGVELRALKRKEDLEGEDEEWVARVVETLGGEHEVSLTLGDGLTEGSEVDGCEKEIAAVETRGGRIAVACSRFQPRSFVFRVAKPDPPGAGAPLDLIPLPLSLDLQAASFHGHDESPDFDGRGNSFPGELFPSAVRCGEAKFRLGAAEPGAGLATACRGQRLDLPEGVAGVYLLATTIGDQAEEIDIRFGPESVRLKIEPWSGFYGQPNRWSQYRGWRIGAEKAAYLRSAPVAWIATHRHGPGATDQAYEFCYLYRYLFRVPEGTAGLELPQAEGVRLFAATAVRRFTETVAAQPLFEL